MNKFKLHVGKTLLTASSFSCILLFASFAQADPNDSVHQFLEGKAKLAAGDTDGALQRFREAIKRDPANDAARYELGLIHLRRQQFSEAERLFREVVKAGFPPEKVTPVLAATLLGESKFQAILDLTPCPNDAACRGNVLSIHAQARLALNDLDGAERDVQAALEAVPKLVAAQVTRAKIRLLHGDRQAAESAVDAALLSNPEAIEALILKGELCNRRGDTDCAIASFRQARTKDSGGQQTKILLILALLAANRDDEASQEIEAILAKAPLPKAITDDVSRFDGTSEILSRSVEKLGKVQPETVMGLYLKSMLLIHRHQPAEALTTIRPVEVLVTHQVPRATYLLAVIYSGTHNLEQALQFASKFNNAFPDDLPGLKLLAEINYRLGSYQRAIDILEPVKERFSADAEVLTTLGSCHLALGRVESATANFTAALAVQPDNAPARARRAVSLTGSAPTREEGLKELEDLARTEPYKPQFDLSIVAIHLAAGEFQRAADAARQMAGRQPTSPMPMMLLGTAEIELGHTEEARRDYEAALARDQGYVPAAVALAQLAMREGDLPAARIPLDKVLRQQPASLPALLARADLDLAVGDLGAAMPFLKAAVSHDPNSADAEVKLLSVQLAQGDGKQALLTVQDLVRRYPDNFAMVNIAATACVRMGKTDLAVGFFRDLEGRQPNSSDVSRRLGELLLEAGQVKEAGNSFRRAVAGAPEDLVAWSDYALAELRLDGVDAALEIARKAAAHNPNDVGAELMQGDILRTADKLAEAERAYLDVKTRRPSTVAVTRLVALALQRGDRPKALAVARDWLRNHPDDPTIHLVAGHAEKASGNLGAAISHFEWITARRPQDAGVLSNLAWSYHLAGDPRALEMAARAYRLAPATPDIRDTYGYLLYRGGDRDHGGALIRQAYAAEPTAPGIAYHMAVALADSGDTAGAKRILAPIVKNRAPFDEAKDALDLFNALSAR